MKWEKCLLGVDCEDFLGFTVDVEGIHLLQDKVKAIRGTPVPTSKAEQQAFFGLLNFYHVFLPHKVAIAEPLH